MIPRMPHSAPDALAEVLYLDDRGLRPGRDELSIEEPLEIRVGRRAICVTMRTPGHDAELAAGFLLGEGVIQGRDDILHVAPCLRNPAGNVVEVTLDPRVPLELGRLTRHVFVSSSCGLCGKASIDAVQMHFPPVAGGPVVAAELLLELPHRMRAAQETFSRTGGLHGATLFSASGELIVLREDVGRHNAVDKAIGWALLAGLAPLADHVLLVSGRASFEILQKALAAGIPIVAAVSAPSSLAVSLAQDSGQTLVGFLRDGRMNLYAHPGRISTDAVASQQQSSAPAALAGRR